MTVSNRQMFKTEGYETEKRECEWVQHDTNQYVGEIQAFSRTYRICLTSGRTPVEGKFTATHGDRVSLQVGPLPLPAVVTTIRKTPNGLLLEIPFREEPQMLVPNFRSFNARRDLYTGVKNQDHLDKVMAILRENSHFVVFSSTSGRRKPPPPAENLPSGDGEDFFDMLERYKSKLPELA